jgi:hypothetical protein
MNLIKTNPDKAFADVKDYLGQTPEEIKATMKDVPLWTVAQSRKYYGRPGKPGPIYSIFNKSAAFWKSIGEIKVVPKPQPYITSRFLWGG